MELRRYMGASIPVHADFVAPLKALARLLRSGKAARYFLYRVRYDDRVVFALKDGRASKVARLGGGDAKWDLIADFSALKDGQEALHRLQRGAVTVARAREDDRLPPWVQTTCRPPGFD
jgi:hypothetical protein